MIFYDTNALLNLQEKILEDEFVISSVSLHELEHIKTSFNKDAETKFRARKVIHILSENRDKYTVVIYDSSINELLGSIAEDNPDNRICACAKFFNDNNERIIFMTDDLCCRVIARDLFGLEVQSTYDDTASDYVGYKEVVMTDTEMAAFYENPNVNAYDLLINQYLIIKNANGDIVDKRKWDGYQHVATKASNFKSEWFGTIKPYQGDVYQQLAMDALTSNQLTMIKGKAGSGKSYLALGYLFSLLDKRKIDKIIMFANPTPTSNAAKIGFLPGTQMDKLLDSSCGNMLEGKLGSKYGIEQLVSENKLSILPLCDIRGVDTTNQRAAIYITEAQNMDVSLMKLALQRIGNDCICILDGDYNAQVDLAQYAGDNNGMRRVSKVFRGQDFYGEVELKHIFRSRIAEIADEM